MADPTEDGANVDRPLAVALRAFDPELRRRAVAELTDVAVETVPLLMQALADEDWRVRKEAVSAVVAAPPIPELVTALIGALEPGDNVGLRNAAVDALAALGLESIRELSAAMVHLDADGRKLAVDALARTGRAEALVVLRGALDDGDANVRMAAIEGTSAIGVACADKAIELLDGCLSRAEPVERLAALAGLNRLGAQLAWEQLEPLLRDRDLTEEVWTALGKSGDVRALAPLAESLDAAMGSRRHVVVGALGDLLWGADEALAARARELLGRVSGEAVREVARLVASAEPLALRRAALVVLGVTGTGLGTRTLVDALLDDSLCADAEAWLNLSDPTGRDELIQRLASGDPRERAIAVEVLGRRLTSPAQDAVAAVQRALDDEDEGVRIAALAALTRIGGPASLERVAALLDPSQPSSLRPDAEAALAALAQRHPEQALEVFARGLPPAAGAVIIASCPLTATGSREGDRAYLVLLLSDQAAYHRRVALDALARLPAPGSLDAIVFALSDEELDVRQAAVRALGRLAEGAAAPVAVSRLLELAQPDAEAELCTLALAALAKVRDPRALPALRAAARAPRAAIAVAAVEALPTLADPRRLDPLVEALSHPEPEVAKAALHGLASQRDARARAHIGACLDHEAWDVRRLAADLIAQDGDPATMDLLRSKLGSETEPLVREALTRALESNEQVGGVRRTRPPPGPGPGR